MDQPIVPSHRPAIKKDTSNDSIETSLPKLPSTRPTRKVDVGDIKSTLIEPPSIPSTRPTRSISPSGSLSSEDPVPAELPKLPTHRPVNQKQHDPELPKVPSSRPKTLVSDNGSSDMLPVTPSSRPSRKVISPSIDEKHVTSVEPTELTKEPLEMTNFTPVDNTNATNQPIESLKQPETESEVVEETEQPDVKDMRSSTEGIIEPTSTTKEEEEISSETVEELEDKLENIVVAPSNEGDLSTEESFKPIDTVKEPVEEPSQSVEEPLQSVEESLQSVEEPLQSVEEPLQSVEEPLQPAEEPLQLAEEPLQPAEEPLEPVKESESEQLSQPIEANDSTEQPSQLSESAISVEQPVRAEQPPSDELTNITDSSDEPAKQELNQEFAAPLIPKTRPNLSKEPSIPSTRPSRKPSAEKSLPLPQIPPTRPSKIVSTNSSLPTIPPTRPIKRSSISEEREPLSRPKSLSINSMVSESMDPEEPKTPGYNLLLDVYSEESPEKNKTTSIVENPTVTNVNQEQQQQQQEPKKETSVELPTQSIKPKKIPPPKVPKKPSSKIAEFQQMLAQRQQEDVANFRPKPFVRTTPRAVASNDDNEEGKEGEGDGEEGKSSKEEPVTRKVGKLNSMFTQNLNGMLGVGLPGMVMPGMLMQSKQESSQKEEEEEGEGEGEGEEKVEQVKDLRRGRAKGPRGRKLPNSVKSKLVVDDESLGNVRKYQIFTGELWNVNFGKKKELVNEPVIETEAKPVINEEEKEKLIDEEKVSPVETPVESSMEAPVKVPVETPVDIPSESSVETPVETSESPVIESSVDIPSESPVETPVETPESPVETAIGSTVHVSSEIPIDEDQAQGEAEEESPEASIIDQYVTSDEADTEPVKETEL
ncbi:hypothetical protein CANARDRAFT_30235 [[Candida] arabinofermentans NRRL YB-2248]|uniref:Altered inheritance of mitochondria protein 21 n=1 Tax=[Candida] arabinofermentans NRRL YB-2248 TaxID=983967 RepID=A0A1E4SUF7_9ASCO|nr:hypothetical protein CANARDRAFT_30235 [[Candida] arabinofermentans NRRL YB-2248]